MLQSLSIKDFILIQKLDLDFNKGFCVITGETGAGKSILLDSILFCFGGKFNKDIIRAGSSSCCVTLVFTLNEKMQQYLSDFDIAFEDQLIIKRLQNIDGKKKFLLNDQIVTQKIVQDLFDLCIELHGQHTHTNLTNPAMHMEILDEYANLSSLKNSIKEQYHLWQKIKKEIEVISCEKHFIEKEIDYLMHICDEIKQANILENEEEKLAIIRQTLQSQDKEIKIIQTIINDLESISIDQVIARCQKNITKLNNFEGYRQINDLLEKAYDITEDIKALLHSHLNDSEQQYSLTEVEDRLYQIRGLARKNNCAPNELPEFLQKSQAKLMQLQNTVNNSHNLSKQEAAAKIDFFKAAQELSALRHKYAKELERKTMDELSHLQMNKARFEVKIITDETSNYSKNGIDKIQFTASTNPGTPAAPIDKIASGGELSRFMLAIRAALFDKSYKQTLIFDEIDVGISGSVSESIGMRLKKLSQVTQVIVITHQPQVAGKADQHILVHKTQYKDQTITDVSNLNHNDKSQELARMISGKQITPAAIKAAKELMG